MLYFEQFPVVFYSLDGGPPILITNIMARTRIKQIVLDTAAVYYTYQIKESDTPEIIADKYYSDPNRYWIILATNMILNPFYDWPLTYNNFQNFIVGKYGSIATAQAQIDHYEKQIVSVDSVTSASTTKVFTIDYATYLALPALEVDTYNLKNGASVTITITKNAVTSYDYEHDLNEAKRTIKILDNSYVSQIEAELKAIFA